MADYELIPGANISITPAAPAAGPYTISVTRTFTQPSATAPALVVKRLAASTANLLELQDETGAVVSSCSPNGRDLALGNVGAAGRLALGGNGELYFFEFGSTMRIREAWGIRIAGDTTHPVHISNASLVVGDDINNGGVQNTDVGSGRLYFVDASGYLWKTSDHPAYRDAAGQDNLLPKGYKGALTATPTTAGIVGDWYRNSTPTSGSVFGWLCITAGAAGAAVWRPFGPVSAANGALQFTDGSTQATATSRNFLTADVINNNATANTLANVTGLSFPVVAGKRYNFVFTILYDAAATTTGARFTLNGPTFTRLGFDVSVPTVAAASAAAAQALQTSVHNVYDTGPAVGAFSPFTTGNKATITGVIVPSAAGNVIARFASEIASSAITVKAGSNVEFSEV